MASRRLGYYRYFPSSGMNSWMSCRLFSVLCVWLWWIWVRVNVSVTVNMVRVRDGLVIIGLEL